MVTNSYLPASHWWVLLRSSLYSISKRNLKLVFFFGFDNVSQGFHNPILSFFCTEEEIISVVSRNHLSSNIHQWWPFIHAADFDVDWHLANIDASFWRTIHITEVGYMSPTEAICRKHNIILEITLHINKLLLYRLCKLFPPLENKWRQMTEICINWYIMLLVLHLV